MIIIHGLTGLGFTWLTSYGTLTLMVLNTVPVLSLGMSSVEVRRLVKVYGDVVALNGIDLSISKGRLFALIGPNGAGKTTLLRIIAGLNKPTSGEVWINGVLVASLEAGVFIPPAKRGVGVVFQNRPISAHDRLR